MRVSIMLAGCALAAPCLAQESAQPPLVLVKSTLAEIQALQIAPSEGSIVPFKLYIFQRGWEDFQLADGTEVASRIKEFRGEADCENERVRAISLTVYNEELEKLGSPKLYEGTSTDWVEVSNPDESKQLAEICSGAVPVLNELEQIKFGSFAEMAEAIPDMRQANWAEFVASRARAERQARERNEAEGREWVTTEGFRPSDCTDAGTRERAMSKVSRDKVHYSANMNSAMYAQAAHAYVAEFCAMNAVLVGRDPFEDPTLIPMRFWYVVGFADCKADWNGSCKRTIPVEVPEGFQICREMHREQGRGYEYAVTVTPDKWLPGVGSRPRFRSYNITLKADGGYRVGNKTSANIKILDLWILFMSDKLGADERRRRGCAMPESAVSQPKPVPKPEPIMVAANIYIARANANGIAFTIANPGNGRSFTQVVADAYDTIWRSWKPWVDIQQGLAANESYVVDAPFSDKVCWRIRSAHLTATGLWQIGRTWNYPPQCPFGPPPN